MDNEYTTFEQIIFLIGAITVNHLCNGNFLNFIIPLITG